ncbi:thiol reductant ABC exporter subunit CydD [Rhodanobacter glycinis]|uniref:Thiol reductant ABC exporter subunit CydD n=1 Tax=Rhodanobacter glycinis TaxID=582702 RepID=A0A502CC02_9GAMM|nr:thiol reductant ABC exporter subunit CydD [Rhodanobacter glycinis]TPG11155.1 thiol reductant ABC exporter subunit CydD [Rhodanobacter glycinis]
MAISPTAWLREQSHPVRRLLTAGIAAGAAQAVLMCGGAWLVAHVLAEAIFAGRRLGELWPALAALPLLAAARFALTLLQRQVTFEAGARVSASVRSTLEERMRRLGPRWAAQQSSGDMVTRLVDGVDALIPYYAGYLPQVALAALIPAVILLVVLVADPWSALVLLLTAPLIPLFMVLVGRAAEEASQRRWLRLRRMGARFMDALSGLTTLRLCRATAREQALLEATGEAYRQETMAVLRIAFLSALVLEFFATVSIAVLAVLIGFRLMWGTLAFGPGLFVLLLAPELFMPLRALGTQRHRRMEAAAAAEDLIALLAVPAEEAAVAAGPSPQVFAAAGIGIALEQVSFGYTSDRQVLHDLELSVEAGTRLTVVGASGSGKSTLLHLLMGFAVPQSGRILINGEDLTTLALASWRRHIAWVPQRVHVFQGTLRDNLLIAAPQADARQLERAVQAAALVPVIARLRQGLDTPLGEHGQGLSGGERQRLALARAWLRDAPLLLLDEPTQHLDAATAAVIDGALAKLAEGRTVIRIAHRLDTIAADEQVAVMADGCIVEAGTASVLRASHGAFARLLAADRAA